MIKSIVQSLSKYNPIRKRTIKNMRNRIINTNATFLTPNCIGGILFHDLGLRFMSPTVNLMMTQKDFLQFVLHLDDYLNGDFEFFQHEDYTCPCAKLKTLNSDQEIVIHFTHYHNETEALDKWNERKKRIDKENIFVFIEERDGITKNDFEILKTLNVKGVVAFTCNEYPDLPFAVCLPQYKKFGEVGNILKYSHLTGKREYEKYFDFVKWFNEADGYPYINNSFQK